jgi:hypothetical protein
MLTRTDYLEGKCTHSEYYAQFVTPAYKSRVLNFIGKEKIKGSTDPNFSNVPLFQWDNIASPIPYTASQLMKEAGDYPTLAGCVCILKEAARQIANES